MLLVECKKCEHQLDPNEDGAPWAPPMSPESGDVGSLVCPNCGNRADFSEWKSLTGTKTAVRQGDK